MVHVPRVSRDFETRRDWIVNESRQSITRFAIASRRAGCVPDLLDPRNQESLERTKRLLTFLEHGFEVEPRYQDEARLADILKLVFDNPVFHFPDDVKTRARALYDDFEASDWGAANAVDGEDRIEDHLPISPTTSGNDQRAMQDVAMRIRLPPPEHPVWGIRGIMHGVCPKVGSRHSTVLDPRYLHEKRTAKVFGHNGHQPGAWFPSQFLALFRGAHGSKGAGISGNAVDGTYSVVVAGMYEDVDEE